MHVHAGIKQITKIFVGQLLEFLEKENLEVNHFKRNIILLVNFPNHIHRQI